MELMDLLGVRSFPQGGSLKRNFANLFVQVGNFEIVLYYDRTVGFNSHFLHILIVVLEEARCPDDP